MRLMIVMMMLLMTKQLAMEMWMRGSMRMLIARWFQGQAG
ncbi:unnamed protein product [Schistocephalus solidus]|uniref:Alternative protein n=1 Tax=Schistocephalus solidus TaxID=70667 RepID=A0A183THM0_SCHSO|nr:unnamed protein product [Schistocephalus solidus]